MGIGEPNLGPLLDTMWRSTGATVGDGLLQPRVEPEIALVLDRDVDRALTAQEALEACREAVVALEVVDSVWTAYAMDLEHNTADGSSAAHVVVGPPLPLEALDEVGVTLYRNGSAVGTGAGRDALGHPAAALAWLTEAALAPRDGAARRRPRAHRRAHRRGAARARRRRARGVRASRDERATRVGAPMSDGAGQRGADGGRARLRRPRAAHPVRAPARRRTQRRPGAGHPRLERSVRPVVGRRLAAHAVRRHHRARLLAAQGRPLRRADRPRGDVPGPHGRALQRATRRSSSAPRRPRSSTTRGPRGSRSPCAPTTCRPSTARSGWRG